MTKFSFTSLRTTITRNLNLLLDSMGWTSTELLLKMNEHLHRRPLVLADMNAYVSGERVPSVLQLTVMAHFFKVGLDDMIDPSFDPNHKVTKGYASVPTMAAPIPVAAIPLVQAVNIAPTPVVQLTAAMTVSPTQVVAAPSTTGVTRRKATHNRYVKLVDKHITGCVNYALAYAVYNYCATNSLTLSKFATSVGCSRRALRDYFCGTSVPSNTAKKLVTLLCVTYTVLGLYAGADKRYHHTAITVV